MSDEDVLSKMTYAQRLELAAHEAPYLRSSTRETLTRKVIKYNQQTGETTGYATGRDVLKGLARIQELEHVVEEGIRPKEVVCENCGRMINVKTGPLPRVCVDGCKKTCACGNKVSLTTARKVARAHKDPVCFRCSMKAASGKKYTEERRTKQHVAVRKGAATKAAKLALTPSNCHPESRSIGASGQCRRCYMREAQAKYRKRKNGGK